MLALLQLSPFELVFAVLAVFFAAIVRGYSGFGFSMLTVTSLSLLRPPSEVVPMTLMLEIAASGFMLPSVWRQVEWRSLRWLLLGTVLATPAGVAILAAVAADTMRLAISVLVLAAVLLLWRGFALRRIPGNGPSFATGVAAGLLNGSAGIGGPPAILFYFASPAGLAVSRASLVTYFLGTDVFATATTAAYGLLQVHILCRAAVLVAPLGLGIAIGKHRFDRAEPSSFRRFVLILLGVLALAGLIRAA